MTFFVSSVAVSRIGRARKKQLVDIGKGGPRDGWQVAANGGIPTLLAVGSVLDPHGPWGLAFVGAYAAATADTWGTEIGTLWSGRTRSIITLRRLRTGLSGGVSIPGTLAEIAGAALVAFVFVLMATDPQSVLDAVTPKDPHSLGGSLVIAVFPLVVAAGFAGALVDSVLGATLQERRYCRVCDRSCETDPHHCGAATLHLRGVPGFSNDWVNAAATATGAMVVIAALGVH